ncbi:MAG: hypothetical protein KGD64_13590 [Candidatus Heimdallarchaeota archaeon]|nr:hypothetical protein [Candidatus Heimdallarchaeota archaeon]
MVYNVVNQICEEVDTDITPFYNSIEIKGDRILLFRDKIVQEVETKTGSYNELALPVHTSMNDSNKDIDEVIQRLREHYKEKLVIFYKSSERRK